MGDPVFPVFRDPVFPGAAVNVNALVGLASGA